MKGGLRRCGVVLSWLGCEENLGSGVRGWCGIGIVGGEEEKSHIVSSVTEQPVLFHFDGSTATAVRNGPRGKDLPGGIVVVVELDGDILGCEMSVIPSNYNPKLVLVPPLSAIGSSMYLLIYV